MIRNGELAVSARPAAALNGADAAAPLVAPHRDELDATVGHSDDEVMPEQADPQAHRVGGRHAVAIDTVERQVAEPYLVAGAAGRLDLGVPVERL